MLALKDALIAPLGDAISIPGAYTYKQYTENSTVSAAARSLAARAPRATATQLPGVKYRRPERAG